MSEHKNKPQQITQQIEDLQRRGLEANGWTYGMWRWFWVWRKEVHDASFICTNAAEALIVESALQTSNDCYPAPINTGVTS